MANVFTKKNHRARTTTLRDFGHVHSTAPRRPRILSPTRRCNPHPTGLVMQSPYNKDNATFDIWNPNAVKIASRMPDMLPHLHFQNFCSGQMKPSAPNNKYPELKYSLNTTTRINYQKPVFPPNVPHNQRVTRFGHTEYRPARGIVPNTLPPISCPPSAE